MKFAVILVVYCAFIAQTDAIPDPNYKPTGFQEPPVWDALRVLRGEKDLTVEDQFNLIKNAIPGKDYPINNVVPASTFACTLFEKQPGFYADTTVPSRCQAFLRCDDNGVEYRFLCPNGTLFNQITLVCDWFFNVDCSRSSIFQDYSNIRLGDQNAKLLDTQLVLGVPAVPAADAGTASAAAAAKGVKSRPGKRISLAEF